MSMCVFPYQLDKSLFLADSAQLSLLCQVMNSPSDKANKKKIIFNFSTFPLCKLRFFFPPRCQGLPPYCSLPAMGMRQAVRDDDGKADVQMWMKEPLQNMMDKRLKLCECAQKRTCRPNIKMRNSKIGRQRYTFNTSALYWIINSSLVQLICYY